MKINDILVEDNDYAKTSTMTPVSSSDYEKLKSFVKHNQVPGVPQDQQIALALFKEIQKQREQNKQLGAELDAAEKRIDTATQSGDLAKQELSKHRDELGRERRDIDAQKAGMSKLDQEHQERAQASQLQIADLADRLEAIKGQPGVGKEAAEELAQQIKALEKKGIGADKVQELEQSIAAITNAQQVDDQQVRDLAKQVQDAHNTAKELAQTKQSLGKDLEATVASLRRQLANLADSYQETDATVYDLENEVHGLQTAFNARKAIPAGAAAQMQSQQPAPQPAPAPAPANQSKYTPQQLAIAKKLGLSGDLEQETPSFAVAEAAFNRSIAWATGKTK